MNSGILQRLAPPAHRKECILISRLESRVGAVPLCASLKARVEDGDREMRRRSPSRLLPKRNLAQQAFASRRSEGSRKKLLVASFRVSATEPRDIVEAHASLGWRAWRKVASQLSFRRSPKHQNEGFVLELNLNGQLCDVSRKPMALNSTAKTCIFVFVTKNKESVYLPLKK